MKLTKKNIGGLFDVRGGDGQRVERPEIREGAVMKNDKCTIKATIAVVTVQKGKKDRHGRFERQMEELLRSCFEQYIKSLVSKLPEASSYSWKQVNQNTIELIAPEAV